MKSFIRFVRSAMAGIALILLGASLLVIGPDRLAELAADPPPWMAVSAIVFVTFAGAVVVAFLAREKPTPVVSEPYEFPRRPQPAEARAPAGAAVAPTQVPARPAYHAAPTDLRLLEAPPRAVVPPPPPPLDLRPGGSSAPPPAEIENGSPAPWSWNEGPPFRPEEARRWRVRRGRRRNGARRVLHRVAIVLTGAGRLCLRALRFAWQTAATGASQAARGVRSATLAVGRGLFHAWRHVNRAARAAAVVLIRGARATGRAVAQAARVTGRAVAHGTRVAARGASAVDRAAVRCFVAVGRIAVRAARAAGGAVVGGAMAAGRGVVHGARAAGQAVVHAAVALEHALVRGAAALSRAGAGGARLVGHAAVQTTRSAAASRGAGRQEVSAFQATAPAASGRPGMTRSRSSAVPGGPALPHIHYRGTLQAPFTATGGAMAVGERRRGIRSSGSKRWHDLARQVHDEHGGDLLLLLQVALRIESKHREFAQEIRAATRPVRYLAGALSVLPLGVVVVAAVTDPGYLARLTGGTGSPELAVAALLIVTGAWWLQRAARPPFTLRPSVRRALRREAAFNRRLEAVLELAALYAAAGLDGKDALREATQSDPDGPGTHLMALVLHGAGDEHEAVPDTPLTRCTHALARWLDEGAPAVDALVLSAARLRHEQGTASALHPGLALPLLVCLVPAAVLLALL